MAHLKNLTELIKETGLNDIDFGAKIYPNMKSEEYTDRRKIYNQVRQLKRLSISIKFETLKRIAEITGEDYNTILGYADRE